MFKLLKEIFRTGEATVKYPFAPLPVEKDMRGKVDMIAASIFLQAWLDERARLMS